MKRKNLKKLAAPVAAIVGMAAAAFFGLDETAVNDAVEGLIYAVLTVLGVFGVIANNDEDNEDSEGGDK
ncbi:hypothetical protein [Salibacterium aidingense]|uniref:hypothetical protein n=1 Tax=Salibacterium aidingense TaxID=384933 RepID=UPI003BE8D208